MYKNICFDFKFSKKKSLFIELLLEKSLKLNESIRLDAILCFIKFFFIKKR